MDINKVWLSGLAVNDPVLTQLPSQTNITTFTLQVNEHFQNKHDGEAKVKSNFIRIETLGRQAETMAQKVRRGGRYYVDGYMRQDKNDEGIDQVKVRVFAVYKDESHEAYVHSQGLRQAIEIVRRSRDKDAAIQALEGLVAAK